MSTATARPVTGEEARPEDLQARVPPVGDKLLVDLVNGIQVSRDLLRFRRRRGFFGRLVEGLTGDAVKRQSLIDGNLVNGLEALHSWVVELTDTLRITETALVYTQRSLLEARDKVRHHGRALHQLDERLDEMARALSSRISELENRLGRLERRQAARDHLDAALAAWEAGRTYDGLPWLFQVALLTHEVWSGPAALLEDNSALASYFVNRVLSHGQERSESTFSLLEFLDGQWAQVAPADLELVCSLLDPSDLPDSEKSPLLELTCMTGEYMALSREERPEQPARLANALQRQRRGDHLPHRVTHRQRLVEQLSDETRRGLRLLLGCGARSPEDGLGP